MRLIQRNRRTAVQQMSIAPWSRRSFRVAHWWRELQSNTNMTIEDLAGREGVTAAYIVRIVRLAFLSPTVLKSIIGGTLPAHLSVKRLTAPDAVPARWDRQFA